MCSLCSKHHFLYFLAGAAAWEAHGHLMLHFGNVLPINLWGFTLTQQVNTIIIAVAGIISIGLLFIAKSRKCNCAHNSSC